MHFSAAWFFEIKHGYTLFKKSDYTLKAYTKMFSVTTFPSSILIMR